MFADLYPFDAMVMKKKGKVLLDCTISETGTADCTVASEKPTGWGFGAAALAASKRFRFKPMTVDCKPVGGAKVQIPVNWDPPS